MSEHEELIKQLRKGARFGGLITLGGVDHDERSLQAANTIEALSAENTALRERVKVLEGALEPFAQCPTHGRNGGPLVHAQIAFEDGTGGEEIGRSPTWPGYIPHEWFSRARAALKGGE